MLITKEPITQKKIQFRVRINENIYNEITEYCQWAEIRYRDFFVEKACEYIFTHDADWQAYQQEQTQSVSQASDNLSDSSGE